MIPIYNNEIIADNNSKKRKNFMEQINERIGNAKKTLFDGTELDRVYCSAFGDIKNYHDNIYLMENISKIRKRLKLTKLTLKS